MYKFIFGCQHKQFLSKVLLRTPLAFAKNKSVGIAFTVNKNADLHCLGTDTVFLNGISFHFPLDFTSSTSIYGHTFVSCQ